MLKSKQSNIDLILFLLLGIVCCLISLPNHYNFRTYALDLGMFNHAMYDFSHGRMNTFLLDLKTPHSYFADHFSPITIILSPFQYIFGTYTPLILQILFFLFGGWGILKYAKLHGFSNTYARIFLIYFFLIWGVINALAFDFHTNVLASMLIIWIFYCYETKRYFMTILFSILVLSCKENMGLWLTFVWSGYGLIQYPGFKKYFSIFIIPSIIYLVYTYLVLKHIMPALNNGLENVQLERYNHWGNSANDILHNFKTQPMLWLELFLDLEPNKKHLIFGPKAETWLLFILSGGILIFKNPKLLWMLIPIFAQKFLSSNDLIQGISYQYSIEFVPILVYACILFLENKNNQFRNIYLGVLFGGVIFSAIYNMQPNTGGKYSTVFMNFLNEQHYKPYLSNQDEIKLTIHQLPIDAALSVNSVLAPHLALRKKIYHFPHVYDAEFVVLLTIGQTYPLSKEDFNNEIEKLKETDFGVYKQIENLLILKRK